MKTQRKVSGFDENDIKTYSCGRGLRVGSHDPFLDPIILLALFQHIEMLISVTNFSEFE